MTTQAEDLAKSAETIAEAIRDAAHILAGALNATETREDARSGHDSPWPVQVDPPTVYDAPEGLKEAVDAETCWRTVREKLTDHAYRGASQAVCTCGWTHAGRIDPRGEWLDHLTDTILEVLDD